MDAAGAGRFVPGRTIKEDRGMAWWPCRGRSYSVPPARLERAASGLGNADGPLRRIMEAKKSSISADLWQPGVTGHHRVLLVLLLRFVTGSHPFELWGILMAREVAAALGTNLQCGLSDADARGRLGARAQRARHPEPIRAWTRSSACSWSPYGTGIHQVEYTADLTTHVPANRAFTTLTTMKPAS
jgi:hypothetical protein